MTLCNMRATLSSTTTTALGEHFYPSELSKESHLISFKMKSDVVDTQILFSLKMETAISKTGGLRCHSSHFVSQIVVIYNPNPAARHVHPVMARTDVWNHQATQKSSNQFQHRAEVTPLFLMHVQMAYFSPEPCRRPRSPCMSSLCVFSWHCTF